MRRAALTLLAVAALVLAGASSVGAASPPLIGGTLSASAEGVYLTSTSTMPVSVVLTASDPATVLTPASFHLAPGETATAKLSGPAVGRISALLTQLRAGSGDTVTAALTVSLAPAPVPGPPYGLLVWALLALAVGALVIVRVRPWQLRVTRRRPMD